MTPTIDTNDMTLATGTLLGHDLDSAMRERLRLVPILASLSDEEFACLENAALLKMKNGDIVARQGTTTRFFWILLEGEVSIAQSIPNGSEMNLHVLPAGTTFGEVPILGNIPNGVSVRATGPSLILRLDESDFWRLMNTCPEVRKAILANMALRLQKMQSVTVHQEKMASLGTLAAGLMHELNNPGAAARRAASQLRENLLRLHNLTAKFSLTELTQQQKECMFELQEQALNINKPLQMNSLEQSDAEERLAEWMENAKIENAWKLAPTLVSIGIDAAELECARAEFQGAAFSDAVSWLEAMVSSMQLVGTIEESIGRVGDLVHAVKSYAYEGKGQRQALDVNDSIHSTLVILGHKFREKEIVLDKDFAPGLPLLQTECSGLNQIWTNLLDNALDAVAPKGHISIRTWAEAISQSTGKVQDFICISVTDDGSGIPLTCQAQIFDPFYTTKGVGVGSGLGLGIVYRIVEQLGGRILFSSEPGNTEFVVRLPSTSA